MTQIALTDTVLVGTRLRQRRLSLGMKQAELAATAKISASYLNLIEHNKRRIGGKLLRSLARGLKTDPKTLSQGAEADLIQALHSAGKDESAARIVGEDLSRVEEFADEFPGWAKFVGQQGDRIAKLEATIDGLNDRLTHDPVLSDTMHDVLSTVSAIRSTASILVATPDIDAEWRHRFHNNIDTESRRLAETSAAMAEHFEHLTQSSATYVTPMEATQGLFEANNHFFPVIEEQGEGGVETVLASINMASRSSQQMARAALTSYAKRAQAMPLDAITDALIRLGTSQLDRIADQFRVDLPTLMLRLAELPHSSDYPDIGCIQADGAGSLITRNTIPGFAIPRFGAACNLWPVFTALSAPGRPLHRIVQSSEGLDFSTYSYASPSHPPSFEAPPNHISTMLIVADGPTFPAQPIGPACRICPYKNCLARREPSIVETFTSD